MTDSNSYPLGWDSERVRQVLEHYEGQLDEDAAEEDEAALSPSCETLMAIPNKFVPAVRALISRQ